MTPPTKPLPNQRPMKRPLPQASPPQMGLGHATVMDRALAAEHGVPYVHLAVFAIDIDRVFMAIAEAEERGSHQTANEPGHLAEDAELPFGWEVWLCLGYLLGNIDTETQAGMALVEESCLHILSFPPGEAALGSELAFAVHAGVRAGVLSEKLGGAFRSWKKRNKQLERALTAMLVAPRPSLASIATMCLQVPLDPPLAPPTAQTLQTMAEQRFDLNFLRTGSDTTATPRPGND